MFRKPAEVADMIEQVLASYPCPLPAGSKEKVEVGVLIARWLDLYGEC